MNPIVYLESSIISYLTARPSRDVVIAGRQAITLDWWENHRQHFELRVSALVEEEISQGDATAAQRRLDLIQDIPNLLISDAATELAELLIKQGAVPEGSEEDALHIAIAAAQGVDYVLTWNFKHINNATTRKLIIKTVETYSFTCPLLCSPEELGALI